MTHTERIRNMVEHKPVDRVGISGWVHMPMVDRNVKDFTKATIDFTDNMNWDFIKLMSNGHYFAEAYGAQIRWRNDPKEWSGEILRYPVRSAQDAANLPVLDPKENPVFQRELQIAKNVTQHYAGSVPVIATIFTPLTWLQEMVQLLPADAAAEDDLRGQKGGSKGARRPAGNQPEASRPVHRSGS